MKAYPKPEKEVVCCKCGKPILSRDDLFVIKNKSSRSKHKLEPIHVDCYGSAFKENSGIKPQKPISRAGYIAGTLVGLYFLGTAIVIFNSIQPTSDSTETLIGLLASLFFLILTGMVIMGFVSDLKNSKFVKQLYSSLPALCERCTKTIPVGKIICAACGWKYGQTIKREKLKH